MKEAGYVYPITIGGGKIYTIFSGMESHLIFKGANPE